MSLVHLCEGAGTAAQCAAVRLRCGPQHVSECRGVLCAEAHKTAVQTGDACLHGRRFQLTGGMQWSCGVPRRQHGIQKPEGQPAGRAKVHVLLSGRLGHQLQGVLCMCPASSRQTEVVTMRHCRARILPHGC